MSLSADLFEDDYRESSDPFGFEDNPFELTKYYVQLALMTGNRYKSALELGCSIGIFTALLAPRCDRLLAIDCAPTAVERTRERCAGMSGVTSDVAMLPEQFPQGTFDLVTFAEFGYYLDATDLRALRQRIADATRRGAHLVVAHTVAELGPYMDCPLPGSAKNVHAAFEADPNWEHLTRLKGTDAGEADAEMYWCDLFERV